MKKSIFVLLAVFCLVFLANSEINAQISASITVNEEVISMSQGVKNSFSVKLPSTDLKDLEKQWAKYLKEYKGKTKQVKNLNEWFTDNAKMEAVSRNSVDLYTVFTPAEEETTRLIVWFDLGGAYLSTELHGEQANAGEKILYDFALQIKKEVAAAKIEAEKEALKEMEVDLEKVAKSEQEFLKTIEEMKAKIEKLEADIAANQNTQAEKKAAIEAQKKMIETAKTELDKIR